MAFLDWLSNMSSVVTVVSMATFIGIVVWTFGLHRSADFDEQANLPFADDEVKNNGIQEQRNG